MTTAPHRPVTFALTLAALGVVYGDIGTSPLYALRECFHHSHGIAVNEANVLGILSLIIWSLILVVSIKYVLFIMRADNQGEGGILALMALAEGEDAARPWPYKLTPVVALGIFAASLLYGDGIITPAISVLSAVEGLEVATPHIKPYVVPISAAVIFVLFAAQKHGTARIGAAFGPIMLLYFATLAVTGIASLVQTPHVFWAIDPLYGLRFLLDNRIAGFITLGSVVLAITGAEALYADMGHFGLRPIRRGWFAVALPALLIQYLGQGALLLRDPAAVANPFFLLAPSWATYPLVGLATAATVIASQAMLTGAFSLSHQAIQLGYQPRLTVLQTSEEEIGQIYLPFVNWALCIGTLSLVFLFETSSRLAAAYGIAVTGTMVITTLMVFVVARRRWHWSTPKAAAAVAPFIVIDCAFLGANVHKIPDGGWLPLALGATLYFIMITWKRGRAILTARTREGSPTPEAFFKEIVPHITCRVPGTAIFLSEARDAIPSSLVRNIRHNRVLHERVVLLTIRTTDRARIPDSERLEVIPLEQGVSRVIASYGFMDKPDVPDVAAAAGFDPEDAQATYFVGRDTLVATKVPGMAIWREKFFAFMVRNSQRAPSWFRIPSAKVVQIGGVIDL